MTTEPVQAALTDHDRTWDNARLLGLLNAQLRTASNVLEFLRSFIILDGSAPTDVRLKLWRYIRAVSDWWRR